MTKYKKMDNDFVLGNSVDIKLTDKDVAEIRADVVVESSAIDQKCNVIRLWGQIKDCNGNSVAGALLKLIKVICTPTAEYYEGVAHTVSDCNGFYQFDLCYCDGNECYKVLVNKAYTGAEQIIDTGTGNCSVCESGNSYYDPCKTYAPIVTPHESCCDKPTPPIKPCGDCYDRPIASPVKPCGECYDRPVAPPVKPCEECYDRYVKPAPYTTKPACGCNGSQYAQSINIPMHGCK